MGFVVFVEQEYAFGKSIENLPKHLSDKLKNFDFDDKDYDLACKTSHCEHANVDQVFHKTEVEYPKSLFKIGWFVHENFLGYKQQAAMRKLIYDHPGPNFKLDFLLQNVNKMVRNEYLQEFGEFVPKSEPGWISFKKFMNPISRKILGRKIKSAIGLNLDGCDGLFLLQAAAIYLYVLVFKNTILCTDSCDEKLICPCPLGKYIVHPHCAPRSPPLDVVMEQFKESPNKKVLKQKTKKEQNKPGRSKPRIVKTRKTLPKKTEIQDEMSVKSNQYNKRFVKTKKPAKL